MNTVLVYLEMHCVFFYKIYGKYYFSLNVYEKVLAKVKFNLIHLTYNTKHKHRFIIIIIVKQIYKWIQIDVLILHGNNSGALLFRIQGFKRVNNIYPNQCLNCSWQNFQNETKQNNTFSNNGRIREWFYATWYRSSVYLYM